VGLRDWRLGLSICFDLRFPEMYRLDALDGCRLFLVVSEWPGARAGILRTLAVARASENQAYLALCNRTGVAADGLTFDGGSAFIAPDGTVLAEVGTEERVLVRTLDPLQLDGTRGWVDLLRARRAGVDW
jgi:predicted amidohydrolase